KIIGSRGKNLAVSLNCHGKGVAGLGTTVSDEHLAAGSETGIESTISIVTQETTLLRILRIYDRSGYQDLAITLERCRVSACVCRGDDAVVTKSRIQSPGLAHCQVG